MSDDTPGVTSTADGLVERKIIVGETERSYLLFVPTSAPKENFLPVVLVFHGGGDKPETMPGITGFNIKAEEAGFAVVYPRGTAVRPGVDRYTWNGGLCCGSAQSRNIDDVGFIRALLADLATVFPVDPKRIYATGLSNGAIMAYRLACELSDQIAAIGPVAGTQNVVGCNPTQPVSVIHFHGKADPF